ncbi:Transcriptional regulator in cluster with unspecified monosaccharide ABC transport system [Altererythrobacter epoxidivorans]|uniref:Transcriptional regulator in cluster with unspecified monosaccharide ABC transport system n=1 Tax=Altererythrobacter epoxidivorans TaxID=361183 RepID=A0A0M4M5J2_9SPHN|nr:helix-turn-helix domain-containing protein [Altererythrobacter epoxidivorans]ALE17328.1 Transcriptional regulator in cluster with unspecified monosaccharide ABC transport system [Altererythrobacter epoxidivorans]
MDGDNTLAAETPSRDGAGTILRKTREAKGLTLDQVASETRIPVRHLEVMEEGDFANLPARTYATGFARTYAKMLGLDAEEIVAKVREELAVEGDGYRERGSTFEPGDPAKIPSAGLAWAGGIAAILLVAGAIAFYSTYYGAGTGPDPLQVEAPAVTEQVAAAPADAAQSDKAAIPSNGQVVFTALEDGIWVRFYDEGGDKLLEKLMDSGERYEVPAAAKQPRINTGRPDALAITIGGQQVPKLAEEPVVIGDAPVSAAALLARAEVPAGEATPALN